jgi:hypothetical protein
MALMAQVNAPPGAGLLHACGVPRSPVSPTTSDVAQPCRAGQCQWRPAVCLFAGMTSTSIPPVVFVIFVQLIGPDDAVLLSIPADPVHETSVMTLQVKASIQKCQLQGTTLM